MALALGLVSYYRFQVNADYSNPGYATASTHLEINVGSSTTVHVEASFAPTSGGKNKYVAQRDFSLSSEGLHAIEWNIQKLPPGKYKVIFSTSNGFFQPGRYVTLSSNTKTDAGKYIYYDDGTTVAKYLEQKSSGQFASSSGQNNSAENGADSSGSTTSSLVKDCGLQNTTGETDILGFNKCFLESFIKCEPAKIVSENKGGKTSLGYEFLELNLVFEILGQDSNMCKVKGIVEDADQRSNYKTGQSLICKLDSEEGFWLSFTDAITGYHTKNNYAINRAETCSGSLFDEMKTTFLENDKSLGLGTMLDNAKNVMNGVLN